MNTQDKNSHPGHGSPAFLAVPLHEYERIRSELEEVRRELDARRTPEKPRWRLLERGEIIEPDDEFAVTGSSANTAWSATGCRGEVFNGYRHAPHRRLIGPGDHDPEECPSCGRRKINHWSLGWTCEDCDLGFYDPYDDAT